MHKSPFSHLRQIQKQKQELRYEAMNNKTKSKNHREIIAGERERVEEKKSVESQEVRKRRWDKKYTHRQQQNAPIRKFDREAPTNYCLLFRVRIQTLQIAHTGLLVSTCWKYLPENISCSVFVFHHSEVLRSNLANHVNDTEKHNNV